MAKELPWWKHEPGEYMAGNIQSCSDAAQGVYTNVENIYWQRSCNITKKNLYTMSQFKGKVAMEVKGKPIMIDRTALIDELIEKGIIKVRGGKIVINFLLTQFKEKTALSKVNSKNGKKGADKREVNKLLSNSSFALESFKDKEWVSQLCEKHTITELALGKWMQDFSKHLIGKRTHVNIDKFKEHFVNWMNNQNLKGKSGRLPNAIV